MCPAYHAITTATAYYTPISFKMNFISDFIMKPLTMEMCMIMSTSFI